MYIPKYICTTVLLFAMPCPERLLPYKAFHTIAQLKKRLARCVGLFCLFNSRFSIDLRFQRESLHLHLSLACRRESLP